jgi:hypothetical protein
VGLAPLPDALDVGGAGEIIAVAWLREPAVLAGGLAGLAARGRGTVPLAHGAARVRSPEGLTVLALPCGVWTSHWPASPQANHHGRGAWKKANGAEQSVPKQIEEHGEGEKYL